jgi:hypothetical protein
MKFRLIGTCVIILVLIITFLIINKNNNNNNNNVNKPSPRNVEHHSEQFRL